MRVITLLVDSKKQENEFMEDNLFLRAVEHDEIISFFTGEGIYFHHSPHTPSC